MFCVSVSLHKISTATKLNILYTHGCGAIRCSMVDTPRDTPLEKINLSRIESTVNSPLLETVPPYFLLECWMAWSCKAMAATISLGGRGKSVISSPEDIILLWFSPASCSENLSVSSFLMFRITENRGQGQHDINVLFVAEHLKDTLLSILWLVVNFCIKETSLIKSGSCTDL